MIYLLIVSLIWAFSFGLIKNNLSGLNPFLVASLRLFISFLVFIPFLRIKNLPSKYGARLVLTGAIQYGLMYVCYISAYKYLLSYEVALLTIFTPFYVIAFGDLFRKKFTPRFLISASISFVGAGVVLYKSPESENLLTGFLLMQISNIAFAFGQIYYKKTMENLPEVNDVNVFSLLYLGGFITAFLLFVPSLKTEAFLLNRNEIFSLLYLGIVASGLGFFLWNYGARRVNDGILGVMNNLKIPLAIAVSLLFFGETANVIRLVIGLGIILIAIVWNEGRETGELKAE